MKKSSLPRFFVLLFMEVLASNMVHPVTPTLLTNLHMPDFMFGTAFASMALANFLFCPFWGAMGDSRGRVKTLVITVLGYSLGQLLFMLSTRPWHIIIARLISGTFTGGATVCLMAYVADAAKPAECGRYMAVSAALTSAATAMGYLCGGLLGDISVRTAFLGQVILLAVTALGMGLFLAEGENYTRRKVDVQRAMNPLSVFLENKALLNKAAVIFLAAVFFSCFAGTAYDNTFNFYLKDHFQFPPSYNGYIYAAIGVMGITVNMTLGMWLQRKTDCRSPLVVILTAAGVVLLSTVPIKAVLPYVGVNMLFYICNSMYLPLQQALAIRQWNTEHGAISGLFSSVRALGMVAGSMSAGFLYELSPMLTMSVCAVAFFAAAFTTMVQIIQRRREKL